MQLKKIPETDSAPDSAAAGQGPAAGPGFGGGITIPPPTNSAADKIRRRQIPPPTNSAAESFSGSQQWLQGPLLLAQHRSDAGQKMPVKCSNNTTIALLNSTTKAGNLRRGVAKCS
jgi:hypothetical protein